MHEYESGMKPSVTARIAICPNCNMPTFLDEEGQVPGVPFGEAVPHLPDDVDMLYNEVRHCMEVNAYTPAVLACRKLLMHIAVEKGALQGESYQKYVDYLATKAYVPPDSKDWVDAIRQKGNDANHEIVVMKQDDAEELLSFIEMLLKVIYEFPKRAKPKPKTGSP
jgi:hypothetical protein